MVQDGSGVKIGPHPKGNDSKVEKSAPSVIECWHTNAHTGPYILWVQPPVKVRPTFPFPHILLLISPPGMGPFAPTVPLTSFHCVPIVTVPVVHSLNYYEGNTMGTEESKVVPIGLVPFTLLLVWENEESKQWEQNGWEFPLFVLPYYYLRKWTNSRERSLFIVSLGLVCSLPLVPISVLVPVVCVRIAHVFAHSHHNSNWTEGTRLRNSSRMNWTN